MKNLMKTLVLALVAGLFFAGSALATPIFTGQTDGSFGVGNNPPLPTTSGYYLWSNDAERFSWSIRWTANNNGNRTSEDWFGSIEFGTGLNRETTTTVQFEGNDNITLINNIPGFGDLVSWQAVAGGAWDGFDFTLSGNVGNVLGFNLGSTLFGSLIPGVQEIAGTGIFIGDAGIIPTVLVQDTTYEKGGMTYDGIVQNFEVPAPVPEPGTLILLGSGLIGAAAYGIRRKKNS